MYYWDIEKLKNDIRGGAFTENDRFKYAYLYILLVSFSLFIRGLQPTEMPTDWERAIGLAGFFIIAIGTRFAFKANGGSEGCGFLERYFSILFVTSTRYSVVIVPLFIAWLVGCHYLYFKPQGISLALKELYRGPHVFFFFVFSLIILYWRVCKHIRDVRD